MLALCSGIITNKPTNLVSSVGRESVFMCRINRTDTRILWYYTAPSASLSQTVFAGVVANDSFGKRYSVHKYSGHIDLKIDNIQHGDAGSYKCQEGGTSSASTADLIVIGKPMVLLGLAKEKHAIL